MFLPIFVKCELLEFIRDHYSDFSSKVFWVYASMDCMKVVATVSLVIHNLWSQLWNGVSNYDIVRQPHKVKDGGGDSASKRTRTKTIIDPHGKFLQDKKLHKLGRPALITDSWKIARRYLWPYFLLDLLVILPIPQVVTSWIFSEMAQTKSSNKIKMFNSFVLLQYVPRILPIDLYPGRN
nr:cyclic nucleotide-gated ion channel 1 [Quercus suber]